MALSSLDNTGDRAIVRSRRPGATGRSWTLRKCATRSGGVAGQPDDRASPNGPNAILCGIALLLTLPTRRARKIALSAPSRRRPWLQALGRRGDPSCGEQL